MRITKREKLAVGIVAVALAYYLSTTATRKAVGGAFGGLTKYPPGTDEQIKLFQDAAQEAGLPVSWATDPDFRTLLKRESGGRVGIPNYTYGSDIRKHPERWPMIWEQLRAGIKTTSSSATGLGQLTLPNVDAHYPDGRYGIGDARNEAIGMLRYIKKRYGSPAAAKAFHDEKGWY